MEQRRPRLGDILDDYCPRERRITNHAVVAMIDDQVKQTRCTTCDADHEYKEARIPPQRRKRLEGQAAELEAASRLRAVDEAPADEEPLAAGAEPFDAETPQDETIEEGATPAVEDDGPVHRRLIRATLPRPEGQVPERKEPEFTVRQPGMRGPDGRKGRHGRRPMRGGQGAGGGWQGSGQGQGQRQGQGGPRQGGNGNQANRAPGYRPGGPPGGPRGSRPGLPGGGRGGRKRGR